MRKQGSILISVLIILSSLIVIGIAGSSAVLSTTLKLQRSHTDMEALNLAEAGISKGLWELNQLGSTYTGETNNTSLSDGNARGAFDVEVAGLDLNTLQLIATGYAPNREHPKSKKVVRVKLTDKEVSEKAAFFYGIQLGTLGANLENNSYIEGNVYGGGTLTGKNGSYVRGSVIMYDSGSILGSINGIELKNPLNTNPPYIYNAWAHSIYNSKIYGDAKYSCSDASCFSGNTVKGTAYPNSPAPTPMTTNDWAIRDDDINAWKQYAASGATYNGFSGSYIGTAKVNGDMTVDASTTTTLGGIVWVTGNLRIKIGGTLQVDPTFGPNSGVVVVDGQIYLENSAIAKGSGDPVSTLMLLSTKVNNSLADPVPAIYASNLSQGSIYYSKDGFLYLNNNAQAKSYAGKGLFLAQNSFFKFSRGIRNPNFTSGPGGRWELRDWQIIY